MVRFWLLLYFTAGLFCSLPAGAQTPAPAAGAFKLFYEKVYLHLDRSYYAAGDTIWFQAYLVNGQSNVPTNTSNNLYVELIAPDAKILASRVIRLNQGS